jgi:hypothetical protein
MSEAFCTIGSGKGRTSPIPLSAKLFGAAFSATVCAQPTSSARLAAQTTERITDSLIDHPQPLHSLRSAR